MFKLRHLNGSCGPGCDGTLRCYLLVSTAGTCSRSFVLDYFVSTAAQTSAYTVHVVVSAIAVIAQSDNRKFTSR